MAGLDFLIGLVDKIKGKGGDTFKEDLAVSESSGNYDGLERSAFAPVGIFTPNCVASPAKPPKFESLPSGKRTVAQLIYVGC